MKRVLPDDLLADAEMWHPATQRWWGRWTESGLTQTWGEVDWSELEACAVLHHEFMKKRTFTLASEIRLRMQKFGATVEDRAKLGIVFATTPASVAPVAAAGVTDIGSRRARLSDGA